jgi:hypothetical protein
MTLFQTASLKSTRCFLDYNTLHSGMLLLEFLKNFLAGYSVKLVTSYRNARYNNPEEKTLNFYHIPQLKSIMIF